MGGGTWSSVNYVSRTSAKASAGLDQFTYDAHSRATGVYEVHETLDPAWVAGDGSPFKGKPIRESRDSDEHPESLPIAVVFDVTGSMGKIPRVLQSKLGKLYGLLLEKGYVEHPQILYAAIGDATCDRVPLQIGQFESDNRADENLENFILEGGGGGQTHETYELAAYYLANHTATDAWEKRSKKGYVFFIGDERNYPKVDRHQVESLIGAKLQDNLSTEDVYAQLQEKWDLYFLFAEQANYTAAEIIGEDTPIAGDPTWRMLLGQNALVLSDADAVCETIALTIGLGEGVIDDIDEGLGHLAEIGVESGIAGSVGKALATVGGGGSAVAEIDGSFDDSDSGAERL
jgi:hypothetical protein